MHHEYRGIYPKEWIDLLRTLEARYNSRRASCEDQKPAAKNKKGDQPDGDDYNIESSPRFPHKKFRPNPGKGKQHNNSSHCGTQNYCVPSKKVGYTDRRYKSYYSDHCNAFESNNNTKDLDVNLAKRDAAVNNFFKTEMKIHKQIKPPKNQNKMMFKLS